MATIFFLFDDGGLVRKGLSGRSEFQILRLFFGFGEFILFL
jgi:hypothetical protein